MTTAFRMPTDAEVADHVADLSTYSRIRYCAGAPIVNECDQCRQAPGWDCKSRTGYTVPFHAPRRRAVEGWDTERRIRAYARLKIVAEWQRAEARARRAEFDADPVKVAEREAGWARQRAAMAAIDAEVREAVRLCHAPELHDRRCRCREGGAPVRPLHQPDGGVAPVVELEGFRLKRAARPTRPLSPFRSNQPGGVA